MVTRSLAALLVALTLVACGAPPPATPAAPTCDPAAMADYAATLTRLLPAYQQQAALTASAPRIGITTPLQRLLELQQEAQALAPPVCLVEYHGRVLAAMQLQQQGFQDFAASRGDAAAKQQIEAGAAALAFAAGQLAQVQAGKVPPTPPPATPTPPPATIAPTPTLTPLPVAPTVVLDTPIAGSITTARRLSAGPGLAAQPTDPWICGGSTVEATSRASVLGVVWYEVRVTAAKPCTAPSVEVGTVGWIEAEAVVR